MQDSLGYSRLKDEDEDEDEDEDKDENAVATLRCPHCMFHTVTVTKSLSSTDKTVADRRLEDVPALSINSAKDVGRFNTFACHRMTRWRVTDMT